MCNYSQTGMRVGLSCQLKIQFFEKLFYSSYHKLLCKLLPQGSRSTISSVLVGCSLDNRTVGLDKLSLLQLTQKCVFRDAHALDVILRLSRLIG